jgi:GT2 family glycosyltransferase
MIYIVIPVHNRKAYTRACLTYLRAQTYRYFRTIVVDDGSTDGTAEMLRAEFPEVAVCRGDGNLWWTEATNVGIRHALQQADPTGQNFILTLNDDVQIAPDYLRQLLDTYYQQGTPCLVGSVCVDASRPDCLTFAGVRLNLFVGGQTDLATRDYANSYARLMAQTAQVRSDALSGRGMLIPFAALAGVGLFDARRYPHYLSDIEYSLRAKKAGYVPVVSVGAVVREEVAATGFAFRKKLTVRQFWYSLRSIKSPVQLRPRYHFARQHSPLGLLHFVGECARIVGGFLWRRYVWPVPSSG